MKKGFTLSELLIALAILGVIATFAIPKVLQAQADSKYKAIVKEAAGMLSEAYQRQKLQSGITANTTASQFAAFFNYVKIDNSLVIDEDVGGTWTCNSIGDDCMVLHNGAVINYIRNGYLGGTGANRAIWFMIDPDGKASSSGSISLWLFYNGRIMDSSALPSSTCINTGGGDWCSTSFSVPAWFSWN
jgi:prepilin-type N-terminal cleavage/methylation domain-containing protein